MDEPKKPVDLWPVVEFKERQIALLLKGSDEIRAQAAVEIEDLRAKLGIAVSALRWYADKSNYYDDVPIEVKDSIRYCDEGDIAREALAKIREAEGDKGE